MTAVDAPSTASHPCTGRDHGPYAGTVADAVWAALGTVMDPELDEPITDLGFVADHRLTVTGAD